ncbi:NAD(P)/FAD-dependent oxidoreductase [Sinosporangium siamense]|uniref:Pyridine nucleotide-disulfide oxidoreductase n=1 Tax=Sinosporangium siamense TaxID=1367973 RepID=A0A919RJR9_9ACTN|nr:FAD/NAD(P)-binding oxidoreductase [Sinosporangium siamense]GII95107.1 pyridine nucleotide-disulfide oxidoreductase [Sinosporangium siamense]
MTARHGTVIVGASIGGFTTAESLRRGGYEGRITVVGEEPHLPYHRPPLSKQILAGEWTHDDAAIAPVETISALGIDLVLGTRATGLDTGRRVVHTTEGELRFDSLVIATGVSARRLGQRSPLAGLHTLRTLDDATGLTADLAGAARVLVAGAGVLGSEIAAGLVKRGLAVTLVGRSRSIRFGQVGALLSPRLADLHEKNGVHLRLGLHVVRLLGTDRVAGAVLSDGSEVAADVVVAAAGSSPRVEWLAGSGLRIADGLWCDSAGRAAKDIYAVGDVARRPAASGTGSTRVEHQQNAIEQALAVAGTISTGFPHSPDIVPFFWSELYGTRIQAYGRFNGASTLEVVAGDAAEGKFVGLALCGSTAVGVVGWNLPRAFREARAQFTSGSPDIGERQFVP